MSGVDSSSWSDIENAISRVTGRTFAGAARSPAGGGCINNAVVLASNSRRYFVKLNDASRCDMFDAEAAGLEEIAGSGTVRVPTVVCAGTTGANAFLVLEYLDLVPPTAGAARSLGVRLAAMHSVKQHFFGWTRDNTIGVTPQPNEVSESWPEFFRDQRLRHQLNLALRRHRDAPSLQSKGERLIDGLSDFFSGYATYPSLLHGDLWSGNFAALTDDTAVVFDPAVYYGDRETDIAMTELFGGFPDEFYRAYSVALPLDAGYPVRRGLYKLYHVLNHLNLFGAGYARQAESLLDTLLAELG
ncbi:MAG TPA: fructosamine kinase family protein [Gammaproteobacteria bacterium]